MDGNDRHFQAVHNALHAALQRQQIAGARDGAFREDADHVALINSFARRPNLRHRIPRTAGAHRNRFGEFEEPVHRLVLVIWLPDHEAQQALHGRDQKESVHVRNVVRHQQRRPPERNVLAPLDPDPEQRMHHIHNENRTRNSGISRTT